MFDRLKMAAASGKRDASDDFWFTDTGPKSSAGTVVTADSALTLSAVFACVRLISETLGQLPLGVFERSSNGDKTAAVRHPIYDLIHDQPNDEHTAIEWREMMTAWAVMRGTAISEIIPGRRGSVDQLIPLHPDYVRCVKAVDNSGRTRWQFEYREPSAPVRRLLRQELFILRAMSIDKWCPVLGIDPITVEKQALGAALAAQDYAARFFANDARPSGFFKHPSHFKDDESRSNWLRAIVSKFTGANRHKPGLLEWGIEYQQVSLTPEQAQFLETRKYHDVDIARMYRVPPHKIAIEDRATFNNIEHQSIAFVTDTVLPWAIRWEQAIKRDLMSAPQFFAEHNVSGLLRGDLKSQAEAFAIGRNWGWLNVNEIRRMLNMNGIGPDGDTYLQPLNMTEAGAPGDPSSQGRRQQDARAIVVTDSDRSTPINGAHYEH